MCHEPVTFRGGGVGFGGLGGGGMWGVGVRGTWKGEGCYLCAYKREVEGLPL